MYISSMKFDILICVKTSIHTQTYVRKAENHFSNGVQIRLEFRTHHNKSLMKSFHVGRLSMNLLLQIDRHIQSVTFFFVRWKTLRYEQGKRKKNYWIQSMMIDGLTYFTVHGQPILMCIHFKSDFFSVHFFFLFLNIKSNYSHDLIFF